MIGRVLLISLLLVCTAQAQLMGSAGVEVSAGAELCDQANVFRTEFGLPPLKLSEELNERAQLHTQAMARSDTFGFLFGEGVASIIFCFRGYATEEVVGATHESWLKSDSNRAKILDPKATHKGVSVLKVGDVHLVTQLLGVPVLAEL